VRPRRTLRSLWASSVHYVRRSLGSVRLQATHHSLGHPWLISRGSVAFSLLLFLHGCLDLFRGHSGVYGEWNSALDVLVVDDLERCASLQRLDDRSERLVLAHLRKLAELLDFIGLVFLAASLVEKEFVVGKVLIGEVVLNLLEVSWRSRV
jgi:hypothetical protein